MKKNEKKLKPLKSVSDTAKKTLEEIVCDKTRFYKYVVKEKDGEYGEIDTRTLKDIASALKDMISVIRNLYDIPTEEEKLSCEISKEKLELDKKKFEESKTDNTPCNITVRFISGDEADGEEYGE